VPGRRPPRPQRRVSPFRAFPPQQRTSSRGGKTQPEPRPRANDRNKKSADPAQALEAKRRAAAGRTAAAAKRSGAFSRLGLALRVRCARLGHFDRAEVSARAQSAVCARDGDGRPNELARCDRVA